MKIDGVEIVEQVDEQRFHIRCDFESDVVDKITQQSSSSCWGLFEMIPEIDSLEDVFVRLTRGELSRLSQQKNNSET